MLWLQGETAWIPDFLTTLPAPETALASVSPEESRDHKGTEFLKWWQYLGQSHSAEPAPEQRQVFRLSLKPCPAEAMETSAKQAHARVQQMM